LLDILQLKQGMRKVRFVRERNEWDEC